MAKKTKEEVKKPTSKKEPKSTPAKKVVVAKVPAKKVPAKKVAAKKEPVKKAAVKKVAVKKVAAKKVEEKKAVDVSDIKFMLGKKLNIKIEGKTKTVNLPEDKLAILKKDIEKYNSMSEKARNTSTGVKLKQSVFDLALSETLAEKKIVEDKKSELKITKKKLENKIKVEENKEKTVVTDIKVTEEQAVKVEQELARHLRHRGYKHPVTGQTWNGERYV